MHGTEAPSDTSNTQASLIVLTRLEAKVDVALATQGADLAAQKSDLADHEARLRAIELRPTVTPAGLWTVVLGVVTAAAALLGITDRFITFTP